MTTTIRTNKWAKRCDACKGYVEAEAGRLVRNDDDSAWLVLHLDGECIDPAAVPAPVARPVATPTVAEGRYALRDEDGNVFFYRVEHGSPKGKWAGFTFVSAQASDDLHPIRNRERRESILAAIAADLQEAVALYGRELGVCGRCGKTLTSEYRKLGIGPVCQSKAW